MGVGGVPVSVMSELSRNLQQALYLCLIRWRHKPQFKQVLSVLLCQSLLQGSSAISCEFTTTLRYFLDLSAFLSQVIPEAFGQ